MKSIVPETVSSTDLLGLLHANGYKIVEGRDAVLAAIAAESDGSSEVLCSGYRVFPDGTKCDGCRDCSPNGRDEPFSTAKSNSTGETPK